MRRCGSSPSLGRTNLIANLFDSDPAHFIKHRDHVPMSRHHFRADRNFDPGIAFVQRIKAGQDLVIGNVNVIKENGVARSDLDRHVIFLRLGRWRLRRRKRDLDAFHVRLAQAHHHETGQEKEHDVDQRDDLDPGSFFRDG